MKRTVLRVKRRRDEPAPDLFELEQSYLPSEKRLKNRHSEKGTEQISHMMDDVGISAPTSKRPVLSDDMGPQTQPLPPPIFFRRISRDYFNNERHKRKATSYSQLSQVNLVEANLKGELNEAGDDGNVTNEDVFKRNSKRKKTSLTLHMVESRIMLETDFWKMHSKCNDANSAGEKTGFNSGTSKSVPSFQGRRIGKSALRERMKRNANKRSGIVSDHSYSSQKSKSASSNNHVILDPLSRKVDKSLCAIYKCFGNDYNDAEAKIMQHIQMLQLSISSSVSNIAKYVNWVCSDGSGSVLHHIALANSPASAREVCRLFGSHLDFSVEDNSGKSSISVAKDVQAENVLEVYKCYGGQSLVDEQTEFNQDEDGYVYDVYCLEESSLCRSESDEKVSEQLPAKNDSKSNGGQEVKPKKLTEPSVAPSNPTVVNVKGGVGYWLDGNLVIDVNGADGFDDSDLEDDDYDSNREDCDGNDYPDDDYLDQDDGFSGSNNCEHFDPSIDHLSHCTSDYVDDSSDDDYDKVSFRNRTVQFNEIEKVPGGSVFQQNYLYENDELGKDEDYRGFMYGNAAGWNRDIPSNNYVAFDPDLDIDE